MPTASTVESEPSDQPRRRVLVVDDEPAIVDAVATALRYEGFEVIEARTGRDGLASAQSSGTDLIVLDVMLPDIDGFEVARRVRGDGLNTPVLFLTARDALDDKIEGFSVGADDYVTKPFSLMEIVVRVRAILQRTAPTAESDNRLTYSDVVLDSATREVWRAGTAIELTATEFNLLQFFMRNPRPRALQTPDPRSRLALRLRWRLEHPRDVHQLCPQETQPPRPAPSPHGSARRLRSP